MSGPEVSLASKMPLAGFTFLIRAKFGIADSSGGKCTTFQSTWQDAITRFTYVQRRVNNRFNV